MHILELVTMQETQGFRGLSANTEILLVSTIEGVWGFLDHIYEQICINITHGGYKSRKRKVFASSALSLAEFIV